jgi:hypothetical protein
MLLNSSPLRVLRRYTYTPEDEAAQLRATGQHDKVISYKDGSLVQAVELYDQEDGSILANVTIPQSAEPDLDDMLMGSVGHFTLRATVQKVGYGTQGQTRDKIKWQVLAFSAVSADLRAAA